MTSRQKQRQLFIAAAAFVAITLLAYGWHQHTIHNPNREHAMIDLTKNMKTLCLGRYLIDIPAQAKFSIGSTEIDSIKIEFVGVSPSELSFNEKIMKREAELRASKHETEGTRLRESLSINKDKQKLFVFREDQSDIYLTWVETSMRSGNDEWKISNDASEEYVSKTKNLVTQLANQLVSRQPDYIPNVSGACIQNGFISGKTYERENFTAGIHLASPDITLIIKSETSGPREPGQTMWDRVDRANKLAGEVYNIAFKPIRRAELTVDSRKGQEYVSVLPDKDIENFNAKAEVYGDATPKSPTFKIEMDMQRPLKPKADDKIKTLTNEDALALWDAVIKSIRPRPGAF